MRLDITGLNKEDLELITNKLDFSNIAELDTSDLREEMEACEDFEEVENGAESCFRFKIANNKWCFIDNNNYVSIEDSSSWREYMRQWDKDLDFNLMQFCLGNLIEYTEIDEDDEDYDGKVKVFKKENLMSGYNEDGWELDDYGNIKIFDSLEEAQGAYPLDKVRYVSNNQFDPTEYIFCKVD